MNPHPETPIHALIRGNNRIWALMYYDALVETDHYQLSFMGEADADYYNCAQAVTELNESQLSVIELFYRTRHLDPAFYLDPLNESWLFPLLESHGYVEQIEEVEHWWTLDLTPETVLRLQGSTPLKIEENRVRIVAISPQNEKEFEAFIRVDCLSNELSPQVTQKLTANLREKSHPQLENHLQNHLFLGTVDGEPAFTGSLGIATVEGIRYGFLAEGGTLSPYRNQGLHRQMIRERALFAATQQVSTICFTCTEEALSNQTAEKMGMTLAFKRRLMKKMF